MKKILLLSLLALFMPLIANAYTAKIDGIYYNFWEDYAEVTYQERDFLHGYTSDYSGTLVIPAFVSYNGQNYNVTRIGDHAFQSCSGLTSITIPNSINSIGSTIFFGCSGLTSINVENGNTTYDSRNGCNAIIVTATNVLIFGCKNTSIPTGVTSIGDNAFYYCTDLTSVTIPGSVTSIGEYAFTGCSSLTSITIPNSVTSIGDGAFMGCRGLTSITIPNSVTSIGNSAFYNCSGLTSVTIPNSVTSIGGGAFSLCSGLTSIIIPNSVASVAFDAFSGTAWLDNQPDGLIYIGKVAYKYKGVMPDGTRITLKDGTTEITNCLFKDCSGLSSITIPNSVTNIGNSAFYGCSGLTSINIPNKVKSLSDCIFYGCI